MRLCEKKEGTAGQHRPSPLGCAPGALGERGSRRSGVASKTAPLATAPLAGGRGAADSHGAPQQAFSRRCKGLDRCRKGLPWRCKLPGAAPRRCRPPRAERVPSVLQRAACRCELLSSPPQGKCARRLPPDYPSERPGGRVGQGGTAEHRRQGPGCALLPPVRGLPVLPRSGAFSPGRASPFCESCAVKIVKNPFVHNFFSIGLLHFRKNALK